jgi:predicted acyl esterase
MQIVDDRTGARGFQAMVPMRDGTRLNTFVFLPGSGGPHWPVILHRTPYGIATADTSDKTDFTKVAAEPRGTAARLNPARMAQHRRARLRRSLSGYPRPSRV